MPEVRSPKPEDLSRVCISQSIACTGINPCAPCEEAFFVAVVEQSLAAAGVDEQQLVRFVDAYWGKIQQAKAEIQRAQAGLAPQQAGLVPPQAGAPVVTPHPGVPGPQAPPPAPFIPPSAGSVPEVAANGTVLGKVAGRRAQAAQEVVEAPQVPAPASRGTPG
jgi:hypothetical protein